MLPFGSPHFTVTEHYDITSTISLRYTMGPPAYSQRNVRQRLDNAGRGRAPTPDPDTTWPVSDSNTAWPISNEVPEAWQAPSSEWVASTDPTPWDNVQLDPAPEDSLPVEPPPPMEIPDEDDTPGTWEDAPLSPESEDAPGTPDSMPALEEIPEEASTEANDGHEGEADESHPPTRQNTPSLETFPILTYPYPIIQPLTRRRPTDVSTTEELYFNVTMERLELVAYAPLDHRYYYTVEVYQTRTQREGGISMVQYRPCYRYYVRLRQGCSCGNWSHTQSLTRVYTIESLLVYPDPMPIGILPWEKMAGHPRKLCM